MPLFLKGLYWALSARGDNEIFPGTIWASTYNDGLGGIRILEPVDKVPACSGADDPNLDEDFDNYSNADEIDAGSDPCNGTDTPDDFDQDNISDLNDTDDDNDGIEDYLDVFQRGGKDEIVSIPFENQLLNNMTGFYSLGFTGIMANLDPEDNYLNWLDVPNPKKPDEDDVYGGAVGEITVKMTAGDALGNLNTQEKAFQLGLNADNNSPFTIRVVTDGPFHKFTGEESQGAFIGTGDQDNYIKIVLNAGGIAVVKEDNGVPTTVVQQPLASTPDKNVSLFFSINPSNATLQPRYAIDFDDKGAKNKIINLGSPYSIYRKIAGRNPAARETLGNRHYRYLERKCRTL